MIVLGILLLLSIWGFFRNTTTRLYFLEKEAEVIDFTDVHGDFDSPARVTGYTPVVRFEVDGKFYEGKGSLIHVWSSKNHKSTIILYNPQNPAEFELKEVGYGPVAGCVLVIIFLIALVVSIYFYLR